MKTIILMTALFYSFGSTALTVDNPAQTDFGKTEASMTLDNDESVERLIDDMFHITNKSEYKEVLADITKLANYCRSFYKLERIPLDWNSNQMRADRLAHFERQIYRCVVQLSN